MEEASMFLTQVIAYTHSPSQWSFLDLAPVVFTLIHLFMQQCWHMLAYSNSSLCSSCLSHHWMGPCYLWQPLGVVSLQQICCFATSCLEGKGQGGQEHGQGKIATTDTHGSVS